MNGNRLTLKDRYSGRFELFDLVVIAVFCAIGLAIKPILNPVFHTFTTALRIPGGSLSGGFLLMWMVLARVIVNKRGVALLFGVAQGLVVMMLGSFGSHGAFTLITYGLPGLVVEVFALFLRGETLLVFCVYTIFANLTGVMIVSLVVMQLPPLLLVIALITATISGLFGGFLAEIIFGEMKKFKII
ncbi:MAG: ECF transporter S component [Candidatus Cloacimonetes bacterium]|nr:ECF transporter S component [Candidatus Cloacimonadota bacterium]